MTDFDFEGEKILASRLGYRITQKFCSTILGRLFDNPARVFDTAMLKPESQDLPSYADGIKNITEAQERVSKEYLEDGSVEDACPPLRALLYIMATGSYEGRDANDPTVRSLFTKDALLKSDWYAERLRVKQQQDVKLWRRHVSYAEQWLAHSTSADPTTRKEVESRLTSAKEKALEVASKEYLASLVGTIGVDPTVA